MPGTVALPHGWGHGQACGLRTAQRAAGANANRLAASGPGAAEPFAGMTRLNGIPVDLTAVRDQALVNENRWWVHDGTPDPGADLAGAVETHRRKRTDDLGR
jgi:hypothetical protein